MNDTKWLSKNPGRAVYISLGSDFLREYQRKALTGGRRTPNTLRHCEQPIPFFGVRVREK
jgi:hypothetical protein